MALLTSPLRSPHIEPLGSFPPITVSLDSHHQFHAKIINVYKSDLLPVMDTVVPHNVELKGEQVEPETRIIQGKVPL